MFARFERPDIQSFSTSGRSTLNVIARIVPYRIDDPPVNPTDLAQPTSERVLLDVLFGDGFE
jgi:hypothetical protein